jgi:hypothetical protein
MKKLIIAFCLLVGSAAQAQQKANVTTDKNGNFRSIAKRDTAIQTDRFFIDSKGQLCPVWKSGNGKLFAIRISRKTGNPYKFYLKPNTDLHDWEGN